MPADRRRQKHCEKENKKATGKLHAAGDGLRAHKNDAQRKQKSGKSVRVLGNSQDIDKEQNKKTK